jgi:hypothetical protein
VVLSVPLSPTIPTIVTTTQAVPVNINDVPSDIDLPVVNQFIEEPQNMSTALNNHDYGILLRHKKKIILFFHNIVFL